MELSRLLELCFRSSLTAIDARIVVANTLRGRSEVLCGDPVRVLALGKAAIGMAWGVADVVDGRVTGVVVADRFGDVPDGLRLIVGGHPLPTTESLEGGAALLEAASAAAADEVVVCLVSGGGSALAEALVPGVSLEDLRTTTDLLLRSGATIDEINAVRTSLSRLKGGGLAAAVAPASSLTLVISDVVGDRLDIIASGPMTGVDDPAARACGVLDRLGLLERVSPSVRSALQPGAALPRSTGGEIQIIASRQLSAVAAADSLRHHGLTAAVMDTELVGEAAPVARTILAAVHPAQVGIYAGETTVRVLGDGYGGRNHEAALAAAIELDGEVDRAFLAAGTDGIDGFTMGAGAVVDGTTVPAAHARGLDPVEFLSRNDSGGFFDVVPGRIVTGPTGTNVGDLWLAARIG